MNKLLKSNNTETYYYLPIKNNNKKKKLIVFSLAIIILLALIFMLPETNSKPNYTFDDVETFKEVKNRHHDYYSQIEVNNDVDAINKNIDRKSIDSLYFVKTIELLTSKRNDIYNNSVSFTEKFQSIKSAIDDYNSNKLNLTSPEFLSNKLNEQVALIHIDLYDYQFERNWEKRIVKLHEAVEQELEKKASNTLSSFGKKTDVKYQNIEVIDSTITQMDQNLHEIIYNVKIDRKYDGLMGLKKYFGTGKWKVSLDKNNKSDVQVFLIEDNYKDQLE